MTTKTKSKTAAKKKKKAVKAKPPAALTFKQLIGRVLKHESAASLIRTAKETGWLTDQEFMTHLTEDEMDEVRKLCNSNGTYKRAKVAEPEKQLPDVVGPLADEPHMAGRKVRITSGDRTIHVDATMFLTLRKRHPNAQIYLSHDDPDGKKPIIFSERSTVAVLGSLEE